MKNKNVKYSIIAASIFALVLAYLFFFPNISPVNKPDKFWKAYSKPVLGDSMIISKLDSEMRNDTLLINGLPKAIIIEVESKFWRGDRFLTIKSLENGQTGIYIEK